MDRRMESRKLDTGNQVDTMVPILASVYYVERWSVYTADIWLELCLEVHNHNYISQSMMWSWHLAGAVEQMYDSCSEEGLHRTEARNGERLSSLIRRQISNPKAPWITSERQPARRSKTWFLAHDYSLISAMEHAGGTMPAKCLTVKLIESGSPSISVSTCVAPT